MEFAAERDGVSVLSFLAGSGGIVGVCAQKAFSCQLLLLHEGEHVLSGSPAQETSSRAAGPREPEAAQTLAYGDQRARGEKGKRCFTEERCIGAVVCSPRRVEQPECSSQNIVLNSR